MNTPARRGGRSGTGWGGAAKGAVKLQPLKPAGDARSDAVRALRQMPDAGQAGREMRAVLYTVAHDGDGDAVRIAAADKLLDRIEGKATVRAEVTGADGAPLPASIAVTFVSPRGNTG